MAHEITGVSASGVLLSLRAAGYSNIAQTGQHTGISAFLAGERRAMSPNSTSGELLLIGTDDVLYLVEPWVGTFGEDWPSELARHGGTVHSTVLLTHATCTAVRLDTESESPTSYESTDPANGCSDAFFTATEDWQLNGRQLWHSEEGTSYRFEVASPSPE